MQEMVAASDSSLLVVFGEQISLELHQRVMALFTALQRARDPRIRNLHPAYVSLLIDFDPLRLSHQELRGRVEELLTGLPATEAEPREVITIPVCYDPEFAPDLAEVAAHAGITGEEVARLHSAATYRVYFLGFAPGFTYLGGLPEALHIPRLASPRRSVAAGSVGIAGSQTGIYPLPSPGGWRLIGRTPWRMFDPGAVPPTRLQPGDQVRFTGIERAAFERLSREN